MLRRIYIDNYKACDNFELEMDSINLLLGDNGVGKSTILEVIEKLRTLLSESIESNESRSAGRLFSHKSLTKWQKQSQQTFELDIESSEGLYKYSLVIDHNLDFSGSEKPATRVARERLRLDEKILLEVEFGQAKLFDDDGNKRAEAMFDWAVSAIPIVRADYNNKQLQKFRELIRNIIVFQVNASSIDSQFEGESSKLDRQARNFAQWYRSMSSDQGFAYDATSIFRDILEGFDSFEYTKYSEENYQLEVKFRDTKSDIEKYSLDELSDGQRALLVLYSVLIYAEKSKDFILCIDEPGNYISLPEIQPWLSRLSMECEEGGVQALITTHHPEIIDYLGISSAIFLSRNVNGPIRTERIEEAKDSFPLSELIARRWIG